MVAPRAAGQPDAHKLLREQPRRIYRTANESRARVFCDLARHHAVDELLLVEVAADENEAAFPLLVRSPLKLRNPPREKHADPLEDVLGVHVLDGQHALVAEKVGALLLDEIADPSVERARVQLAVKLD